MIKVNKKHSVEYKNGYFILKEYSINESGKPVIDKKTGKHTVKKRKTYPDIGSMVLQCGFKIDYEYTDAAMKSKADYEKRWNDSYLREKTRKDESLCLSSN